MQSNNLWPISHQEIDGTFHTCKTRHRRQNREYKRNTLNAVVQGKTDLILWRYCTAAHTFLPFSFAQDCNHAIHRLHKAERFAKSRPTLCKLTITKHCSWIYDLRKGNSHIAEGVFSPYLQLPRGVRWQWQCLWKCWFRQKHNWVSILAGC